MDTTNSIEFIQKIELLANFPQELQEKIAGIAKFKSYAPDERILLQGQENRDLFFLLQGQVGVIVDGRSVASLEQMGDVVGEMSVISQEPVSATIVAETPVKLMIIDAFDMMTALGQEQSEFEKKLFQGYAMLLAEKLRATNQKAKYFEDVSATQMTEVYKGQELTFKKLNEVSSKHLVNLKKSLDSLKSSYDLDTLLKAVNDVEFITQTIQPIAQGYQKNLQLEHRKVLLIDSDKKSQTVAKLALGGSGTELSLANDVVEGKSKIMSNDYDIVFIDSSMVDLIQDEEINLNANQFVLMTSSKVSDYIQKLMKFDELPNVVSRDPEDRTFTTKNIMTTVNKYVSDDIFGLERYLAWGVEVHEEEVTGSEQRHDLNDKMVSYFSKLGVRKSILDPVTTVSEEMLMNAVYDAPTGPDGKPLYNHLDRTQKIVLPAEEAATFRFAMDGMLLAVSVIDPFGALQGKTILKYLESCYEGHAGKYNSEKGGAGRGLHMIVELSDLVVFNIAPDAKTEVICLFNLDTKSDESKDPSFHYFCKQKAKEKKKQKNLPPIPTEAS